MLCNTEKFFCCFVIKFFFATGIYDVWQEHARNDLVSLYEMLQEGKTNYEILEENPKFIGQVERMDKVRQIIENERYKLVFRDLEVTYIYGDTGTGKTRGIMEKYGYDKVYGVTDYKYPFDQYASQDVIVFEEFHSSLPITSMFLYLDGYPVMLSCRYSNKVACYRKVYILSNIELDKQKQHRIYLEKCNQM